MFRTRFALIAAGTACCVWGDSQVNAQVAVTTIQAQSPVVSYMPVRRGLFGLRRGYLPVVSFPAPTAVTSFSLPTPTVTSLSVPVPTVTSFSVPVPTVTSFSVPVPTVTSFRIAAPGVASFPVAAPPVTTFYAPLEPVTSFYVSPEPAVVTSSATTTYYAPVLVRE